LDKTLKWETPITHLIHGGARGADSMAHEWAMKRGVQTVECMANWTYFKNSAGPKRNKLMALLEPDLCIAFPGETGTANCVKFMRFYGIPVTEIRDESPKETPNAEG